MAEALLPVIATGLPQVLAVSTLVFWVPTVAIRLLFWLPLRRWLRLGGKGVRVLASAIGGVWLLLAFLTFLQSIWRGVGLVDLGILLKGLGVLALGFGLVFLTWSLRHLGFRRLFAVPIFAGPLQRQGEVGLVTSGPYSHTRHPLYYAELHVIGGVFLLTGAPVLLALLVAWCILSLLVIRVEERELRARYGRSYQEYVESVPRLIPWRRTSRR